MQALEVRTLRAIAYAIPDVHCETFLVRLYGRFVWICKGIQRFLQSCGPSHGAEARRRFVRRHSHIRAVSSSLRSGKSGRGAPDDAHAWKRKRQEVRGSSGPSVKLRYITLDHDPQAVVVRIEAPDVPAITTFELVRSLPSRRRTPARPGTRAVLC
jgi:hypothetical protein